MEENAEMYAMSEREEENERKKCANNQQFAFV